MSVRDFFVQIPGLCGAKNADRWAELIGMVYDAELAGGTEFDRSEADKANPDNRLEIPFAFVAADEGAKEQCRRLCRIIMYSHYLDEHGEKEYAPLIDSEYYAAKAAEKSYPEIAEVMTADEAVTEYWAD